MPCLSLRHHHLFRSLFCWVESARRQASPAIQSNSLHETAELPTSKPAPALDASTTAVSATVVGETLFIPHYRDSVDSSSLSNSSSSDQSLADLVDAKLRALVAPAPTSSSTPSSPTPSSSDSSSLVPSSAPAVKTVQKSPRKPFSAFFQRSARLSRPRPLSSSELLNAESRLGSTIFGPIPEGHRREFFHHKQNIWIWHESWLSADSTERQITVRYEIRPNGIYKKYAAGKYIELKGAELTNFRKAAHAYLQVVKAGLYAPTPEVI